MRLFRRIRRLLRPFLAWRRLEEELDDELRFHLEQEAARHVRAGLDPEMARRRALLAFGGVERFKEAVRDVHGTRWLEHLVQDARYGVRTLRRSPGFTIAAVLTLALGIGANTAIFSVVDAVLLRPLAYGDPGRLMAVWESRLTDVDDLSPVTFPMYRDWLERSRAFEALGAYTGTNYDVTGGAEPVRVGALAVTSSLLPTLGVRPYLGRNFGPAADRPGAPREVLLAYGFWQRNFGGDRGIVGRTIELNGAPYQVVGVLPEGFEFPPPRRIMGRSALAVRREIWVPAGVLDDMMDRGGFYVLGRLAPGITLEQARAELATVAARLARERGDERAYRTHVVPLREQVIAPVRPALLAFLGAVALVLLIACVNLGSLMLARLTARDREISLRAALGAGRGRIVRQLLAESMLLALLGAGLGVLLARGGLEALIALAPADVPRIGDAALSGRALGFTLVLAVITGVIFGLLPALRASRADLRASLAAGGAGTTTERSTRRVHGVLVVAEVAFAVALLAGAGLLIRSFAELAAVDPGFETENLLIFELRAPPGYRGRAGTLRFYDEVEARLAAIPGVRAVSATDRLPFGPSSSRGPFEIVGRPETRSGERQFALNLVARPGYFETMGIPLLHGRTFDERDAIDAPRVAIVSRALAERVWPDGNGVGARIVFFGREWRIIGVVGDVRHFGPAVPPEPMIYFSQSQDIATRRRMVMVLRTAVEPEALIDAVRAEIRRLDPRLPISNLEAFGTLGAQKVSGERFNALLVGVFAALALALAAVGIYGVMSFTVARQTREIAVRIALGASDRAVIGAVLRRALALVAAGTAAGIAAAVPLARLVRSLLFGIGPDDPLTFAAVAALPLLIGLLAAWVPAWRAAHVDPMGVLRAE